MNTFPEPEDNLKQLSELDIKKIMYSQDLAAYIRIRQATVHPSQERINEISKAVNDLQIILLNEFAVPPFQLFNICNSTGSTVKEILETTISSDPSFK